MARYYGYVGYAECTEDESGIVKEKMVTKPYYGDIIQNARRLEASGLMHDNITILNEVSIVADPYAFQNFHAMRYLTFMGCKWKITNIRVEYPRLILTAGGIYNE